jgi:hypothetical protein
MQHLEIPKGQVPSHPAALAARIEQAERAAGQGGGKADALYVARVQVAYAGNLAAAPDSRACSDRGGAATARLLA